ncbi:MAG: aldose 1-epimerase family protein [Candidatus Dormibacteria bacterium]
MTSPPSPPSGEQFAIANGEQRATVVEVGGGIREYFGGTRPVLDPYPLKALCDGAHGAPLIPWPNRLADGRYRFDGQDYQVPLTEPEKQNAIHGLLRWRSWSLRSKEAGRATLGVRLYPTPGYPFLLDLEIEYRLDDQGLTVTTTARNLGDRACPYGLGQHPYLSPGEDARVDDCSLELVAATRILTDPERQLPVGREAVAGSDYDFRQERKVGGLEVDYPFTDLERDQEGRAWARLRGPDGRRAELWVDRSYPILEIYTGDTLSPERRRRGLGTEPMSCPPNGFQTGEGLIRLEPGAEIRTAWGARLA